MIKFTRLLASTALATSLLFGTARADTPVIDASQLFKWVQQAQQMQAQLAQLEAQLRALTDVPNNLAQMVGGLLQNGVGNPLGQIEQNLQVLLKGQGTGTCAGSNQYLTQYQYAPATGTDFTGQMMNQSANRNAGLQACTQVMMQGVQNRLTQMPGLLTELQGATDLTQVAAISGRIQYESAVIGAQQAQVNLMAQTAMVQHLTADDQVLQKQRADANEVIQNTSPGAAAGAVPSVTPFVAPGA